MVGKATGWTALAVVDAAVMIKNIPSTVKNLTSVIKNIPQVAETVYNGIKSGTRSIDNLASNISKVSNVVKTAFEAGKMPALATEYGSFGGRYDFYEAASTLKTGFKDLMKFSEETEGVGGVIKGVTEANLGNLNGKTPATRVADKFRSLPASKRPNTVATIRTKDGKYIIGRNSGGVINEDVQNALDIVGINEFEGQCAEVNALARAMNKGIDLDGATISVSNVRGINSTNGVHGTFKKPCSTCEPLLEYFKILVNKGDK